MADRPTYEEFCVARHLANTRDDDLGKFSYQVCRWHRGSMFIRQEAEIALTHIRDVANRPDGVVVREDENGRLAAALRDLADVVETAIDSGLFLSIDGKRPDVMALAKARELLSAVEG